MVSSDRSAAKISPETAVGLGLCFASASALDVMHFLTCKRSMNGARGRSDLRLLREGLPALRLIGAEAPRHPGNLNVMLPGLQTDLMIARLQPSV